MRSLRQQFDEVVEQNHGFVETTNHQLIWGWLRLFLGVLQISLSVAGITALLKIGFRPLTWAFVAGATIATISSLFLYRGRSYESGERSANCKARESKMRCRL